MKLFMMMIVFFAVNEIIGEARIGVIYNASLALTFSSNMTINSSTCNGCLCAMLTTTDNAPIVSLNCINQNITSIVCQLFTISHYQNSTFYTMRTDMNSTFYFLQLPSEKQLETTTVDTKSTTEASISATSMRTTIESTTIASTLTALNVNLVTNGDAEIGPCATDQKITSPSGWNYDGPITQVSYNVSGMNTLSFTNAGPNDRGRCYFFGHNSSFTSMWQTINLNSPTDHVLIDNHTVKFNFSAWIGGYRTEDDNARVSLKFIDQLNQIVGQNATIGPVLANERGYISSLLFKQVNGLVPIGTRSLRIDVQIIRGTGTWNGGFVDNIVMILY